jgi:hypothetical protein
MFVDQAKICKLEKDHVLDQAKICDSGKDNVRGSG